VFDSRRVEKITGWKVHHHERVHSTNNLAASLRDRRAGGRVVVVADRQEAGRGRGGRDFLSPPGGLYASLLVGVRPADLTGLLTAAVALASAEAIEAVARVDCAIKWPNDLWIGRRKVGGILLEAAGASLPVIVGLGVNLDAVPAGLDPAVRAWTTSLDAEGGRAVAREDLLEALLPRVDAHTSALGRVEGRQALAAAWRARIAFVGEPGTYVFAGRPGRGRLLDVDLDRGLEVQDEVDGRVWRGGELVRDVRPRP
jgi:BirA family biotin operon repressor/biotin-[acetyl-CoA-carboxylase] ligase